MSTAVANPAVNRLNFLNDETLPFLEILISRRSRDTLEGQERRHQIGTPGGIRTPNLLIRSSFHTR